MKCASSPNFPFTILPYQRCGRSCWEAPNMSGGLKIITGKLIGFQVVPGHFSGIATGQHGYAFQWVMAFRIWFLPKMIKSIEMGYRPYRQYYLSLDIDLTKIKTRSKFVRTLGFVANSIKIPAPALQISRKGVDFKPFYF